MMKQRGGTRVDKVHLNSAAAAAAAANGRAKLPTSSRVRSKGEREIAALLIPRRCRPESESECRCEKKISNCLKFFSDVSAFQVSWEPQPTISSRGVSVLSPRKSHQTKNRF